MSKPLHFPRLAAMKAEGKTDRDIYRLDDIMAIRIANPHLRVIGKDDTAKRMELCFRYWAQKNPKLGPLIREILYTEPDFFKMAQLTSTDTILRDSRELEILGFFEKPVDEIKAAKPMEQTTLV